MIFKSSIVIIIKTHIVMPIKVSHTNKKNTFVPVQILLDEKGKEVKNFSIGPQQFFYAECEFITSSMRVATQRQLVKVEQVDEKPANMNYYVVYAPGMVNISNTSPSKPQETEATTQIQKQASELVKEYTEENQELKTGKWDDEEEMYLKRLYARKGAKYIAEKLNRAEKSVYKKAEALGLKKRKSS